MRSRKVYIDIGHGDKNKNGVTDPGAVATIDGVVINEFKVNQRMGHAFADKLRSLGHIVMVEANDAVELMASAAAANRFGAEFLFCFHQNAGNGQRGEVYYSKEVGAVDLANCMAATLGDFRKSMGCANKVNVIYKAQTDGREYLGILRGSNMPAVLLEPCFIDNETDRKIVLTATAQIALGEALAMAFHNKYGV
jgi:N-acetylmuramoyl-L-alanine amidase